MGKFLCHSLQQSAFLERGLHILLGRLVLGLHHSLLLLAVLDVLPAPLDLLVFGLAYLM